MRDVLKDRSWFPSGMTSYVNIQRQFFDAFVGQTFKVEIYDAACFDIVLHDYNRMLTSLVEATFWSSSTSTSCSVSLTLSSKESGYRSLEY